MSFLKSLFGGGAASNLDEMVSQGALILDVRTPGEYKGGHVKGSKNIPLNELKSKVSKLDKSKPIITCCASGMRSGSARKLLLSEGFENVVNGGSYTSLLKYAKN